MKKDLLAIAQKLQQKNKVSAKEIEILTKFKAPTEEGKIITMLSTTALPLSIIVGITMAMFPDFYSTIAARLPSWTNLSPELQNGADYIWNLLSEPVAQANILYHLPNIVLYSFGVVGIKKLFEAIDRRTWIDKVLAAQTVLLGQIEKGTLNMHLKKGHSVLFIGRGDFIGMQFVLNHKNDMSATIADKKPEYTNLWNYYNAEASFDDLKIIIERSCSDETGEYIFFPVKDDQIFLPGVLAYDLSPHKLDILCQNIRSVEKEKNWHAKKIIIVGDRYHQSYVQSEDEKGVLQNTADIISIESIEKKYKNIGIIDPTDVVLQKILEISQGRKIVFRATQEGHQEYKSRFYERLMLLGYKNQSADKGVLTIGYDLSEDLTEQQTLARKIDDYYPVVLSKNVCDALLRNGYNKDEFIYVPDLVLETLTTSAARQ